MAKFTWKLKGVRALLTAAIKLCLLRKTWGRIGWREALYRQVEYEMYSIYNLNLWQESKELWSDLFLNHADWLQEERKNETDAQQKHNWVTESAGNFQFLPSHPVCGTLLWKSLKINNNDRIENKLLEILGWHLLHVKGM